MIKYVEGDATDPHVEGNKIIVHVCNDEGTWGRGFVLSLSRRWAEPENAYRLWSKQKNQESEDWPPFSLGNTVFVKVSPDLFVANMIAQRGIGFKGPPIRYYALLSCLQDVATWALGEKASVHMPRIGCGLAGGEWSDVERILDRVFVDIDVYVYDFREESDS